MVSLWADVGNADHDAVAITELVNRCKGVGMFMVCRDYLVTALPVEAVADNIHAFARVIGACDLLHIRIQQAGNAATNLGVESFSLVKCFCTYTPFAPFVL